MQDIDKFYLPRDWKVQINTRVSNKHILVVSPTLWGHLKSKI